MHISRDETWEVRGREVGGKRAIHFVTHFMNEHSWPQIFSLENFPLSTWDCDSGGDFSPRMAAPVTDSSPQRLPPRPPPASQPLKTAYIGRGAGIMMALCCVVLFHRLQVAKI